MPDLKESIIIVGAGVFGLSTAFELRKRGYENITVLDRMLPPVPDGSSVDISRIIRSDYTDPFYATLALEAIKAWSSNDWNQFYHNSGFVLSSESQNDSYIQKCKDVLRAQQKEFTPFQTSSDLFEVYPVLRGGLTNGASGYVNHSGGWADAAGAIRQLASRCSELGVSFMTGARGTVQSLIIEKSKVMGVRTAVGDVHGSRVVLATGAWTNRLVNLTSACSSSGQPVGFIQLKPEEAKALSKMPVVINMSTGFFVFPPTPHNHILKIARHSHGFECQIQAQESGIISAPKNSNGAVSSYLPEDAEAGLREGLQHFFPQYADRPWARKRLCWYTDTPEGNFMIDSHPTLHGLFIAAGGAGHAFKFLPVLGRHIVDCFENKASKEMRDKWKLEVRDVEFGSIVCNDGSRRGPARRRLGKDEQARL